MTLSQAAIEQKQPHFQARSSSLTHGKREEERAWERGLRSGTSSSV